MDGVMVALDTRGITLEACRQCTNERVYWRVVVREWILTGSH